MAAASVDGNIAVRLLDAGREGSPAILHRGDSMAYGELRSAVNSLAASLLATGSLQGERLGLFSENAPFFVTSYLGIIRAGLCAVPFPADITETAFRGIVELTEMRRVLVQRKHLARVTRWTQGLDCEIWAEGADGQAEMVARRPPGPGDLSGLDRVIVNADVDLAAIVFTSGSTGQPKGVMISHRNIACNTADIVAYLGLAPSDRVLAVLPLSYCYGASLLHTHLSVGGSVVLAGSFMFPERVLDELESTSCTGFAGVPSTYQILLRKTNFKRRRFPALRWLQQAGGRLPGPFLRELRQVLPDVRLFVMYGQTEATARLSYLAPEQLDAKFGSIGRGLPSTRLEVISPSGDPITPGSDQIGEIVASGGNIARGYYRDPEETARYFRDGKLYTGDMARVDADGFIYIVGRARDFIKCMGNRVGAKEIEEIIMEHPGVIEAAVIGVPHELLGEAPWAFVVLDGSATVTPEQVIAHCNSRLPNYKVPQTVVIVDDLSKNSSGKILKPKLLEIALDWPNRAACPSAPGVRAISGE